MKKVLLFLVCLGAFLLPGLVWARPYAYIANGGDNNVSVIDLANDSVIKTISISNLPMAVAVSPDGTKVYVASSSSNILSVIDVATNVVVTTITVGNGPMSVVFSPDGAKVYVANYISSTVSVIDTRTSVVENIVVGNRPFGIAINPAGTKAYVSNILAHSISVIDLGTNTVSNVIDLGIGKQPREIIVNPSGTKIYATVYPGSVYVIDAGAESILSIISVQDTPIGLAINNTGAKLYVANYVSNSVSVIDTASNVVVKNVVCVRPAGLSLNPSNSKLFVSGSGMVSVINTEIDQLLEVINAGSIGELSYTLGNFITPASVISPSATEVDFTKTRIGKSSKKQTLTITNQGKLNLNISSISLTGDNKADFKIKTNTCSSASISPSGTCEVGLIFKPKKVSGSKSANLLFVSDDPENPTLNVAISGKAIFAKKFVTKKAKAKEVLVKKKKIYYADNLDFVFSSLPKKLKKTKYYLNLEKKATYPLNYVSAKKRAIKKYFKVKTNLGKYSFSSLKKLYSIKMTFKYSQKEFKNLKKRNKSAKEKNLFLKFRTKDSDWRALTRYWKGASVELNTNKNTFTIKYFSKFEEKNYYFGIGLK